MVTQRLTINVFSSSTVGMRTAEHGVLFMLSMGIFIKYETIKTSSATMRKTHFYKYNDKFTDPQRNYAETFPAINFFVRSFVLFHRLIIFMPA